MSVNDDRNGNCSQLSNTSNEHREDEGMDSPCLVRLKSLQGILFAVAMAVLYSTLSTLTTALENRGMTSFQLVFLYYLPLPPTVIFICLIKKENVFTIGTWNIIKLLILGLFRWLAITLSYSAYKLLPLGDVVAIISGLIPILTALAALVCLHEKWSLAEVIVTLVNVVGVVLVTGPIFISDGVNPDSDPAQPWTHSTLYNKAIGFSMAVGSGICYSLSFVLVRSLKDRFSIPSRLVYDSTLGLLLSTILLYATQDSSSMIWLMGLQVAMTTAVSVTVANLTVYAMLKSFELEAAATASIIINIEIFTTYMYQVVLFKVKPDAKQIIGAVLIVLSSVIVFILKWRRSKQCVDTEREAVLQELGDRGENSSKFGSFKNRE